MDNYNILKVAYIQTKCEPNNIVKVAGILGKLKRWLSGLFDEGKRKQIDIIDKKYDSIKYLLIKLQDDIKSIETSIEDVNVVSYDANVAKLINTIELLQEKLETAKQAITDVNSVDIIEEDNSLPTVSNKDILSLFSTKTLADLGIENNQIKYSQYEQFYNSLRGQDYGNGNAARFFDGNQQKLEEFINVVKKEQIAQDLPNKLLDFKVIKVLEPKIRERKSNLFEVAELYTKGVIPIDFHGKKIGIVLQVNLHVFMHSIDNLKKEISNAIFAVSKQYVYALIPIGNKIVEKAPKDISDNEDGVFDKATTEALDKARKAEEVKEAI